MKLKDIYDEYQVGSQGFCIAVETHCGYEISRPEIERIAVQAPTPDDFQRTWEDKDWWVDENHNDHEGEPDASPTHEGA